MLPSALAQEIAGDTSAVIGFNVLITDERGVVVGSGAADRVGTLHEASLEALRAHAEIEHTVAQAERLRGVRPGVTLPLVLGGELVGTVGITGSPARVRRFGRVVRRQIEILLQESDAQHSRLLRERALEDLVRDVAAFDADLVEPGVLVARARGLGYTLGVRRAVVLFDVRRSDTGQRRHVWTPGVHALRPEVLRLVRDEFGGGQDIAAPLSEGRYAVLAQCAVEGGTDRVRSASERVVAALGRLGQWGRAGIGQAARSVADLHDSCLDAEDALALGARLHPDSPVHEIDGLRVPQTMAAVASPQRRRLVAAAAAGLAGRRDWPVHRATVIAWCESGFHLVRAAEALGVHRNTLVHRLARVEELTGRCPRRDTRSALALYLACVADQVAHGPGAV